MIARLNGKDYTSAGDYVKDLEQDYYKIKDGYYDYKTKYEQIIGFVHVLVSAAQEFYKEEK